MLTGDCSSFPEKIKAKSVIPMSQLTFFGSFHKKKQIKALCKASLDANLTPLIEEGGLVPKNRCVVTASIYIGGIARCA